MIKRNPLVMVPGPTPVARSIQDAMGRETISFNDPRLTCEFNALVSDLVSLWRCDGIAFVVAGSGTMGMEMGIVNTASSSDRVLICSNGYFGDRMADICSRKGFDSEVIKAPACGMTVSVEDVDKKLSERKFDILVLTHVETSTGVEFPLKDLTEMMRAHHPGTLIIVDGVASMGGVDFYMDWGVDVMLSCSQKCFGTSPGLALLWASRRAVAKRRSMPPIAESYIDFEKWIPVMEDTMRYWGTPAVNMIWALSEAVRIIKEEGLENRFKRHRAYAKAIRRSISAMGFKPGADESVASPTVTVCLYPEGCGLDDADFRDAVYSEGAHVAGCLGELAGRGFRIGHMGNIDEHILVSLIAAIERACIKRGYKIKPGVGLASLQESLLKSW
ncbi:MAG: alanine--glyoxylate aminotransferase family protein [Synergistaceae bacterium]|jgi:aspartate aminotransferase-like enzyme|nr:alanine--glyoxylate aminotransferase family protein [Synergistaceae bacterium]